MAFILLDYLSKPGLQLVEARLRLVVGKPASWITNDDQYRQMVVQRAWEALPPPIRRMMGGHFPRWEELCRALREQVFDLTEDVIALRSDAHVRLATLLRRYYSPEAATAPGAPPPPGPPVAAPVFSTASTRDVPLAMPVSPPPRAAPAAKPAAALAPDRHRDPADLAVGIDLGTTYSLVAYVDAQGRPCTIPNGAGDHLTPSAVLFEEGGTIVGKEALLASAIEPERVAECVKRDMGAKYYRKKIKGGYLPPEVISSLILRSLVGDAERALGPVRKAVITVPAYFEETRRRATMDAGRLAGLQVLDIINEPTAAAIAYGYHLGFLDRTGQLAGERPLRVLVYDLGGGTFDVTIIEINGTDFRTLATDGDVCLGGKDWDERLVQIAAERMRHEHREDPRNNPVTLQELWLAAETAKRTLTERKKATLYVNHLGSRMKVEVTREEFEEATVALLERTRMTAELVVRQAGLTWADIDRVLLVGGSTRMPMVTRMLEELSGKTPDRSLSVDEAVAHGAALYAELLTSRSKEEGEDPAFSVTDVNSHSLGILGVQTETERKVNRVLIPKNSPLPRTVTKVFQTYKPGQRSVAIKVLEGESDRPEVCTRIGVCQISNLPAGWPVLVSYTYEANGRLHVSARVKGHQAGVTIDFQRENGLVDEDLELWANYVAEDLRDLSE